MSSDLQLQVLVKLDAALRRNQQGLEFSRFVQVLPDYVADLFCFDAMVAIDVLENDGDVDVEASIDYRAAKRGARVYKVVASKLLAHDDEAMEQVANEVCTYCSNRVLKQGDNKPS